MKKTFIFSMLLLFSNTLFADCGNNDFSVTSLSPSVIDFTDSNQVNVNYTVTLQPFTNTGNTRDCFFYGFFNYGFYGTGLSNRVLKHDTTSDTLPFNVYSDSSFSTNSIVRLDTEAASDSHVLISAPHFPFSASTQSLTRTFFANLGTVPVSAPAGTYSELLTLNIASRRRLVSLYTWNVRTTRAVQFIYRIDKALDLSLVSTGGVFDPFSTAKVMNFGKLDSFETQTAEVIINTNVGYRLSLSSQNNGSLKHADFSHFVNYTFSVSGSPISLLGSNSSPVLVSSDGGISPSGGFVIPLSVQIGSISGGEPGGVYSDIVQFNIEAF